MTLKRIGIIALALAAAACASTGSTSANGRKRAALAASSPTLCAGPLAAVTGNNATITIYSSASSGRGERVRLSMFYDQAVTVLYQVKLQGSASWRTVNGNGSGDAISASTLTVIDYRILAYDSQIQVVTGGTGPSVSETEVCLVPDAALAM